MPAAIFTGAVLIPVFQWLYHLIEKTCSSQVLALLWTVLGFLVPVLVSTADLKYAASKNGHGPFGFFYLQTSKEDFRRFYFPAWKRLLVLFLSCVTSILFLKAVGVEL